MTLASHTSLSATSGDDLELTFTVTRDDAAVDITNMTPRFVVAREVGDTPVISTETSPVTATVDTTDAATGIFVVSAAGEVTQDLIGTYEFQAEIEDGSGGKSTVSRGVITFKADMI